MRIYRQDRILFYSRLMRMTVLLLIGILISAAAYFFYAAVFDPALLNSIVQETVPGQSVPVDLSPGVILALGTIGSINLALVFGGLFAIWQLCHHLDAGTVFTLNVGYYLRKAGFYALASSISQFLSHTLCVLAVTYYNAEGQRQLAIAVSSNMIFLLLIACLLTIMGHIMVLASQIAAENREFV